MKQTCQILLFPLSSDHIFELQRINATAGVQIENILTGRGRDRPVFRCVYIVDTAVDFNWQQLTSTVNPAAKIRLFRLNKLPCNISLSAENNSTRESVYTKNPVWIDSEIGTLLQQ